MYMYCKCHVFEESDSDLCIISTNKLWLISIFSLSRDQRHAFDADAVGGRSEEMMGKGRNSESRHHVAPVSRIDFQRPDCVSLPHKPPEFA